MARRATRYLLFVEYPLRLLVDVVEVVAIGGLKDCGKTLCIRQNVTSPHVLEIEEYSRRMLNKAVQQGRRRIETGGGTDRTSWSRSPVQWILANGKTPPVFPTSENRFGSLRI